MIIKLPDNFFGAALSGPQTEGAYNVECLRSYWDMWSDQEITLSITMLVICRK